MAWILIAVITSYGFIATFDDKAACEAAATKLREEVRPTTTAFCVPRGSERQP